MITFAMAMGHKAIINMFDCRLNILCFSIQDFIRKNSCPVYPSQNQHSNIIVHRHIHAVGEQKKLLR